MHLLFFILAAGVVAASAKPPELTYLFPVGAQPGASVEVKLGGKVDPWPPESWCEHPGIELVPGEKAGAGTLKVVADIPPGSYLIALRNSEGFSKPRWIEVHAGETSLEQEPNDVQATAHSISNLPVIVEGQLAKRDDVDHFSIPMKKGKTLSARLAAYVLDSPVDAMLHLFDAQGVRVAFNHDAVHLDPWLVYNAEADGVYVLQLSGFAYPPKSQAQLQGSAETVYRLHLKLGEELPVRPFPALLSEKPRVPGSMRASLTNTVTRLPFSAKAGQVFHFDVWAATFGHPTDPVLRILVGDDKQLASADDGAGKVLDPSLSWTAKSDGEYVAEISDLHRRSGEAFRFQLDAALVGPTSTVSTTAFDVVLDREKPVELEVQFNRLHGDTNRYTFVAEGLPPGVWATAPEAPAKSGKVKVSLQSAEDLAPVQQPFELIAVGAQRLPVKVRVEGAATPGKHLPNRARSRIWLTVPPIEPEK